MAHNLTCDVCGKDRLEKKEGGFCQAVVRTGETDCASLFLCRRCLVAGAGRALELLTPEQGQAWLEGMAPA